MRTTLQTAALLAIAVISNGTLLYLCNVPPAYADTTQDRYLERIARAVEKIADRADRCK